MKLIRTVSLKAVTGRGGRAGAKGVLMVTTTRTGQALPTTGPPTASRGRMWLTLIPALLLAACSAASPGASSLASPDMAATPTATPLATPAPTPIATPSPLPEGTYQTAPIPTATLKATAKAAGFKWDASRWTGKTTVWAIRLASGHLNWFGSSDGAPLELSSSGMYEVTDAHTVAYTDAENPSSGFTLTFSLEGDVLTTHVDPDPPDAGIEAVIFFNSAPFVRQP